MSIIKKISLKDNLGTDVIYDIGANAENVMYDENTSIKDKLDNLNIRYKDSQLQIWDETNEKWVNEIQIDDLTFYVDGTNGSDTNAGTQSSPFATISKAVEMIGNDAARAATANIIIADGTYTENINIVGKNISMSGVNGVSADITIVGTFTASKFAKIYLNKIKFNLSTITNANAIVAKDGAFIAVVGGSLITGDGNDTGFYAQDSGIIQVSESSFNNMQNCFSVNAGTIRVLNNPSFTNCNTGCVITNGGVIHIKTDISALSGITTPYNVEYANGGRIFKGTSDNMIGATSTTDGASGVVPKPLIADREKFLKGDGTWAEIDSDGHTIFNDSGAEMPQRSKLQFKGVSVTDDAANDATVVECEDGFDANIVAPVEVSPSAHAYDKGNQLIYDNNLYKATRRIDIGDELSAIEDSVVSKTWNGLTSFIGEHIWTDGESIYYSYETDQYVLDKSTSTWTTKTWNGLTSFNGANIWTDGENIYYSSSSDQYVLDKATSTWNAKIWNGLTSFNGANIWTDGENIYYSNTSPANYVFLSNNITLSDPIVDQIDTCAMTNRELTEDVGTLKMNLKATYDSAEIPFKFGIDENGNYGYYKDGADTVTPFKTVVNLGSGTTFNVSNITGYKNFTADNFYVVCTSYYSRSNNVSKQNGQFSMKVDAVFDMNVSYTGNTINPSIGKSYNSSTGVLTISNTSQSVGTSISSRLWSGNTTYASPGNSGTMSASISYYVLLIY